MRTIGPLIASARMPVLAGLITLLLGGCVTTIDHPVEPIPVERVTQPVPARTGSLVPADQGEWRLRLSYL